MIDNLAEKLNFGKIMRATPMKKTMSLAILLCFAGALQAQIPDFELKSANDNSYYNIKDLKGEQLTVIDFWATWCKPCISALPKLNKLSEEFKNQGVSFIGVSTDGPRNQSKVRPFINTHGILYPVLRDPDSKLMDDVNATVLPTLLIYDKNEKLVYYHEGFTPGTELEIKAKIEELLSK